MNKHSVTNNRAHVAPEIEPSCVNIRCGYCGAQLPTDITFQEYHMQKVHGLIV
jgi:hypothetical protein